MAFDDVWDEVRTSRDLENQGISRATMSRRVRSGTWRRLRRGVYVRVVVWTAWDDDARRAALPVAVCRSTPRGVLSHASAALAWGCPTFAQPERVHLSLPGTDKTPRPQAVVHRGRDEVCSRAVRLSGLRATDALTTALDCARSLPLLDALAVADSLVRHGHCALEETRAVMEGLTGPGSARARRVARLVSEGTDSIAESGTKIVLNEGRVEPRVQQHLLTTRTGRRYFADFCWPERKVILEFDGQVKYGRRFGKTAEVIREEHSRQRELEAMGRTVVRASWEDITRFRRDLVERLRAAGVRAG